MVSCLGDSESLVKTMETNYMINVMFTLTVHIFANFNSIVCWK